MILNYIAHVFRNPDGTWAEPHSLKDHLSDTANRAEFNAGKFNSGEWGKALGLAHDAGKGREVWQGYLKKSSGYDEEAHLEGKMGKIPHAIHGAKLVEEQYGKEIGRVLSYCIAGHHAGLPDWSGAEGEGRASLEFQLKNDQSIKTIDNSIIKLMSSARPKDIPWSFEQGLDLSLWIRMLYSSLVDADFLDTEYYMDHERAGQRGGYLTMSELQDRLYDYIRYLEGTSANTKVNQIRREIRTQCLEAAKEKQGIFSLSVPTGGGKTLSTLAFGLEHSIKHQLDRIIYVIPYTSIIEQNADVFRAAVGKDQVVEHHSNILEEDTTPKVRLASENWDAPIIVTTSVQFFESLFSSKSSQCRKLHNIARSVVILDEAQLVPIEFLQPILETMQLLAEHYQVTFLLSTATQPAFKERIIDGEQFNGLKHIKEIMGDENKVDLLYKSLERYQVYFPESFQNTSTWEEIAKELQEFEQVLCIVSDRKSCRELYMLMPEGTFHLSALMCGQHRSETIKTIKQKLSNKESVRVISTQLIEAGVDLDFPVVYRALAGLDSIVQAAGRCNREGKMSEPGRVFVFVPPRRAPLGILRKAADTTCNIVARNNDPLQVAVFEKYFTELYWKANSLDTKGIIELLQPDRKEMGIYFRTAAKRFRIIDDSQTKTILVPFGEGEGLIDKLKIFDADRILMRRLQRYAVNIYNDEFTQMLKRGSLYEVSPGIFALNSIVEYSDKIGLLVEPVFDPGGFII